MFGNMLEEIKWMFFTVDGKLIPRLVSYQRRHRTHVARTVESDSPLNSDLETALGLSGTLKINCTATA